MIDPTRAAVATAEAVLWNEGTQASLRPRFRPIREQPRLLMGNSDRLEGSENSVMVYGTEGMATGGRWQGGLHEIARVRIVVRARFALGVNHFTLPVVNPELTVMCHLGNIVSRTGRTIHFDAKSEIIKSGAEANRLVNREYRTHWSTPKGA